MPRKETAEDHLKRPGHWNLVSQHVAFGKGLFNASHTHYHDPHTGVGVLWNSREHRKGHPPRHYAIQHGKERKLHFPEHPPRFPRLIAFNFGDISWWVAALFTLGSCVWVVNGWYALFEPGSELFNQRMIGYTGLVGGTIFELGGIAALLEALNAEPEVRVVHTNQDPEGVVVDGAHDEESPRPQLPSTPSKGAAGATTPTQRHMDGKSGSPPSPACSDSPDSGSRSDSADGDATTVHTLTPTVSQKQPLTASPGALQVQECPVADSGGWVVSKKRPQKLQLPLSSSPAVGLASPGSGITTPTSPVASTYGGVGATSQKLYRLQSTESGHSVVLNQLHAPDPRFLGPKFVHQSSFGHALSGRSGLRQLHQPQQDVQLVTNPSVGSSTNRLQPSNSLQHAASAAPPSPGPALGLAGQHADRGVTPHPHAQQMEGPRQWKEQAEHQKEQPQVAMPTGEHVSRTKGGASVLPQVRKWRWWGFKWRDIGWLASFIQLLAATVFWIAVITGVPKVLPEAETNYGLWDGVYWTPQVIGGAGFIISAGMFMLETQKHWWQPRPFNLGWHVGLWNMVGGVGFCLSGIFGYWQYPADKYQYWGTAFSTFWGSWAFLLGSYIQLYEAINKQH